MPIRPEITVDTSGAERRLAGVKGGVGRAVAGAINDVMKSGRTRLAKAATAQVNMKYGRVLRQIRITRATPTNLAASIGVNDKARPGLMAFGARQTARGVTYRIGKVGKRQRIAEAFVARGRPFRAGASATMEAAGAQRVFRRAGKPRKPLIDLKGPSLNRVITANDIDDITREEMAKQLPGRIEARVDLVIARTARG